MGIIIHETHVICIPETDVASASKHMSRPKTELPELPIAVLSQVTGIAKRIGVIVGDISGVESDGVKALLIEEAVINAVSHGNQADVTKEARVKLRGVLTNGIVHLQIVIEDEGTTLFSVQDEIDEALDFDNLERPNGRGMLMMREVAKYSIEGPELLPNNSGKRLTFTKDIPLHTNHTLSGQISTQA